MGTRCPANPATAPGTGDRGQRVAFWCQEGKLSAGTPGADVPRAQGSAPPELSPCHTATPSECQVLSPPSRCAQPHVTRVTAPGDSHQDTYPGRAGWPSRAGRWRRWHQEKSPVGTFRQGGLCQSCVPSRATARAGPAVRHRGWTATGSLPLPPLPRACSLPPFPAARRDAVAGGDPWGHGCPPRGDVTGCGGQGGSRPHAWTGWGGGSSCWWLCGDDLQTAAGR